MKIAVAPPNHELSFGARRSLERAKAAPPHARGVDRPWRARADPQNPVLARVPRAATRCNGLAANRSNACRPDIDKRNRMSLIPGRVGLDVGLTTGSVIIWTVFKRS
jgi:hypothetical protein